MKFCEECGAQLEDNALFCEECGTPVEPAESAQESGNEAGTVQSSEEAVKDESKTTADQVQESAGMPQNITPPQKEKKKGAMAGGVIAGVVIVAAIVAVVLWQCDFSAKKAPAPTENPYPTEKPLENALDQKKQSGTSKKSKSEKSQTTAKSKKKNTESKLQKQWNGTYVIKDETAALRFRIILHSKDNIEIEYVQDEYEEGVSYAKLTAALSDKNTFEVTDADWTSISSAMLSEDTNTLSVYSEDGDLAGEFERSTQYVIPGSSTRKLTKSDIKGLSSDELRIARNEIYARHGRMFDDIELQQHFYNTDWYIAYQEADQFDENKELSKIEKYNVKFISKYE